MGQEEDRPQLPAGAPTQGGARGEAAPPALFEEGQRGQEVP